MSEMYGLSVVVALLALVVCVACEMPVASGATEAPVHAAESNAFVQDWLLCGPFPNPEVDDATADITRAGYATDYLADIGGEAGCRPRPGTEVEVEGRTCTFAPYHAEEPELDLRAVWDMDFQVAYAYTTITSESDQTVFFHLGSDDGVKVWLNGERIHAVFAARGLRRGQDVFAGRLREGRNALLAKVEQVTGGWGLALEILEGEHHLQRVSEELPENVGITYGQSGPVGEELSLRPDPRIVVGDVLDGAAVEWIVRDAAGEAVARTESVFEAPASVELPAEPGFYEISMAIPSLRVEKLAHCLLAEDRPAVVEGILQRADRFVAEGDARYAGWVAYRRLLARRAAEREGTDSPPAAEQAYRLHHWLGRLEDDPLPGLRGGFEWAYLSKVDGSGQPFSIFVPDGYDPERAHPLRLVLHGRGGTHSSWVTLGEPHPEPYLEAHVMGRARGGGYVNLSEVDVLEVFDYVTENWNVDPRRVWLTGGSMGGGGTFNVASRHPDLFASGQPECGYGAHVPVRNLLHVPFYSLHSDDDWTVPVVLSRLPVQELNRLGGRGVQHETTGLGHGIWQFTEGVEAAHAWERRQVRPEAIDRVAFKATDRLARGAYWAQVLEWGPRTAPATFDVRVGRANFLYLRMHNVGVLALDLTEAPVDRSRPMTVVAETTPVATLAPPLPETLYVSCDEDGCSVTREAPPEPAVRRHFPGGAPALYHGEPLMVVWGTGGDAAVAEALRTAGKLAQGSPSPGWHEEDTEYPMDNMLFARLPGKADRDVTEEDIQHYNLLLLGTPEQNSVVASIAEDLPVTLSDGFVRTSDGLRYPFESRTLGLLHYNPRAPHRLIYWLAAHDPVETQAGVHLIGRQAWEPAAADFMLAGPDGSTVTRRGFRPDWQWEEGYRESEFVPEELCSQPAFAASAADAFRWATQCDYALLNVGARGAPLAFPGETRWADLTLDPVEGRPVTFTLTGAKLLAHAEVLAGRIDEETGAGLRFVPEVETEEVEPDGTYRIVCPFAWPLADYARQVKETPSDAALADAPDAIERYRFWTERSEGE